MVTDMTIGPYDLKGKTALVTGASRGIGRAIALGLASCGAHLVINYAGNEQKAREVKAEAERFGVSCRLAQADLAQPDCAERLAAVANQIDILVLNASVQFRNPWNQIPLAEIDQQVNTNFRSSLLLVQHYAPGMIGRGWGRIITVGSVQEAKPHPDMVVYAATKAAQTHMGKALAIQLAPHGVTVNNIAPGVILTDRNTEALQNEAYAQAVLDKIPLKSFGEADDLSGIVLLLCSEQGRYITGQNIYVDGGMGIR
ncbi:MAG: SDR family oxidoreductase [Clostridiaceae bacterium]|jgi:NAD(P)-dependent dehydrogenase (short-subunit alcohol dehydrogenase family)|nr:SDR family oxidoreductase [Eubacteriales bacterium]MDD4744250.1 SDR family oxidoreductase [Eubacteriales bacterium]NLB45244.1 SDR family oxidoreductase [Clostridiaceae bacterium]